MVPVYGITLDLAGPRAQRTQAEFAKYDVPVTFIRGFKATKWGLATTIKMKDHEGKPYYIGPHHIGCSLSHWMLWNHLLVSGVKEALIVEDDVKLCDNFKAEFDLSYSQLPANWEYVFVGYCCAQGRLQHLITQRVWDIRWPMCTHCYMVKASGMEAMMEPMAELREPCDIAIHQNVFMKDLIKVYTFVPNLAAQYDTYLPP